MRRFNPGDKVVYISHDCDNHFYPKCGTIGTIVEHADDTYIVQWPVGSVSAPYKWHALDSDLELATKETEEKDMFKVGDRVQIKTMEELAKEFPVRSNGDFKVGSDSFVSNMSHLCGRFATIKSIAGDVVLLKNWSDESGDTDWGYTLGMLKKAEIPFKVGDRVEIKSWDEMVKEFGAHSGGYIKTPEVIFAGGMAPLCGKTATITAISGKRVFLYDWSDSPVDTGWDFTVDMIKKPTAKTVPHAPAAPVFKVGDIVRGTKKADDKYCITNSAMIKGRVTKCFEATNMIEVQILNHKTSPIEIGETYTVRPEYFELVSAERAPTEPPKTGFKVGDIVRGKEGNRYGISNSDMERAEVIRATARTMRVKVLKHRDNYWERYEFDVDNSNKEFELVEAVVSPSTADSFEMVFKPPFTYAVLRDAAGHVVAQGEAKCSSEDTFSKPEGAALATQRLLEKLGKPNAAEKPFFSRDNLKTGDWVYTAEDVYQVFESPAFGKVLAAKSGWLAVADFAQNLFDDDPTGDNEFNVCKVVRPTKGYHLCYDHRADGECIFERK